MSDKDLTIRDRLEVIMESIELIQEWSKDRTSVNDFMDSPGCEKITCSEKCHYQLWLQKLIKIISLTWATSSYQI